MPNPTIPNFPPQGIQAQLDLLYLYNPDAANKLLAELQAGLTDLKELEARIMSELGGLQDVVHLRGTVTTEQDLPEEHDKGDLWEVSSTNTMYIWDGAVWKQLGGASTLPTQEGNSGKFLSTDGEKLLWAEVQQGGGSSDSIEWFASFSATPQQIQETGANGAGLRFEMPELPAGTYGFYSTSTGLPDADNAILFTNKLRYTVFQVNEQGNILGGLAYFASRDEQSYVGNSPGSYQQELWVISDKKWFTNANNHEGRSEISMYAGDVTEVYQTVAISKIKNLSTNEEYEPLNVSQWFATPEDYGLDQTFSIFRQELVNVTVPDYATATYTLSLGQNVPGVVLYGSINPWWTDWANNPSRNSLPPAKHLTVYMWTPNETDRAVFDIEIGFDGLKATKVLATGGFAGDYTIATNEDLTQPNVAMYIYKTDGEPLTNEIDLYISVTYDTNPGAGAITIGAMGELGPITASTPFVNADVLTKEWVTNNFINADASTYTLASLQDAFTFSNARLMKVFNEDKMPTKDSYTLFSLGWTYNDSNNAPSLIAVNLATGKMYFYQGTYENCSAEAWQEFAFGEGGGSGLPDQTGHTGFLQTNGTVTSWSDKAAVVNNTSTSLALAIGDNAAANQIGGIALGANSKTGNFSIAIGESAQATARRAIQLGEGTNSEDGTMKVGLAYNLNVKLLEATGRLPAARLAANGTSGQVLSKTDTGMEWVDLPAASGANAAPAGTYSEYGVKGDYCSTYAVIKTPNGRPYIKSGANNTIVIPAGMVIDCPLSGDPTDESKGLITIGSEQEVEIEETTDCYLVYVRALGEFRACNTLCFTPVQPEDGTEPCKMWFDGAKWWFKSDDTGNVWRTTRAHPVCKCIFTEGVLTRLNFIGWYDIVPDVQ